MEACTVSPIRHSWAPWRGSAFIGGSALFLVTFLFVVFLYKISSKGRGQTKPKRTRFPRSTPPVFPNGWIPVLESSELPVGGVKRLDAFGEELVAFRTEDGVANVTDAYCPHLGAHLGVMGRVVGDCIECPFHGWRFKGKDGSCSHVPYAAKVPEFVKIKKWETEEILGLVFVWYHADAEPPTWRLTDVPEITDREWTNVGIRNENLISCHIQELAENAADIAHFNHLHGPSFLVTGEDFNVKATSSWWGRLLDHDWETSWTPEKHLGVVRVNCKTKTSSTMDWLSRFVQYKFDVLQIGPALVVTTMRTGFGDIGYVLSLTPEKPFQVRAVHRYFPGDRIPRFLFWIIIWGSKYMFERDVIVWDNKAYMKNPALVKEDKTILAFRKWFSQFYSESSPTWEIVRDKTMKW